MDFIISPSSLSGSIIPPPSKSQTLRAIIFAMMGKGKSEIENFLDSSDTTAMINALHSFGIKIEKAKDKLIIEGQNSHLNAPDNIIDIGNSGICFRFLSGIAALLPFYTIITGDDSIRHQRPMKPLLEALLKMNVFAVSAKLDGFGPVIIKGPLYPGKKTYLLGEDSQHVSALLIACAFLKGSSEIFVEKPKETPWIDLTLSWFDNFKIKYQNDDYKHYIIYGNSSYKGFNYKVKADLSNIAYPLIAAIITNSEITIDNIDFDDPQGDKKLIDVLIKMGANIKVHKLRKSITVYQDHHLKGLDIDVNPFIDALPILAVLGCFAEGRTTLYNAEVARTKESDRLFAITHELKKMKAHITEKKDSLIIEKSKLKSSTVSSHKDHRIAMSLSVAALAATGSSCIKDIDCINKTYPSFLKDFQSINANIKSV